MLHTVKIARLRIRRLSVLCCLLFSAVLALVPLAAEAQCTNWDASGDLTILQRGAAAPIVLRLEQKGRALTGAASTEALDGGHTFSIAVPFSGQVDGSIGADAFSVQIFWSGGLTGVYVAKILPSGKLDGETYDKNNSKIRQPWHSEGIIKCVPAIDPPVVVQSAPPRPKPISRSGRMPKVPPAAKVVPPYITASPAPLPYPGAQSGFAIVTWDAGPDHPYAEVWVKVNGGDETFVVEQGKGARQVVAERGKTYLYILTDSGTTLAKAGVVLPPL